LKDDLLLGKKKRTKRLENMKVSSSDQEPLEEELRVFLLIQKTKSDY